MTTISLKEQFKREGLLERVKRADSKLCLTEALDEQFVDETLKVIGLLEDLDFSNFAVLDKAKDSALSTAHSALNTHKDTGKGDKGHPLGEVYLFAVCVKNTFVQLQKLFTQFANKANIDPDKDWGKDEITRLNKFFERTNLKDIIMHSLEVPADFKQLGQKLWFRDETYPQAIARANPRAIADDMIKQFQELTRLEGVQQMFEKTLHALNDTVVNDMKKALSANAEIAAKKQAGQAGSAKKQPTGQETVKGVQLNPDKLWQAFHSVDDNMKQRIVNALKLS